MSMKELTAAELAAKQAITDVIHRYCRGLDRMDKPLTLSCWHPGGTDDHAPLYAGSAAGFLDWLWPVHAAMVGTRHCVSNILIELNGPDRAASETYWTLTLRTPLGGDIYDILAQGRYVDTWERIEGVWAIRHRQSLADWNRVEKVEKTLIDFMNPPLIMPNNLEVPAKTSARDRSDYSYSVLKS
jgi:hypothetical protein